MTPAEFIAHSGLADPAGQCGGEQGADIPRRRLAVHLTRAQTRHAAARRASRHPPPGAPAAW